MAKQELADEEENFLVEESSQKSLKIPSTTSRIKNALSSCGTPADKRPVYKKAAEFVLDYATGYVVTLGLTAAADVIGVSLPPLAKAAIDGAAIYVNGRLVNGFIHSWLDPVTTSAKNCEPNIGKMIATPVAATTGIVAQLVNSSTLFGKLPDLAIRSGAGYVAGIFTEITTNSSVHACTVRPEL